MISLNSSDWLNQLEKKLPNFWQVTFFFLHTNSNLTNKAIFLIRAMNSIIKHSNLPEFSTNNKHLIYCKICPANLYFRSSKTSRLWIWLKAMGPSSSSLTVLLVLTLLTFIVSCKFCRGQICEGSIVLATYGPGGPIVSINNVFSINLLY